MAEESREAVNPRTGERIVFRQTADDTDGALLEMDDYWQRPDHRVTAHVHPEIEERWEVVSGAVRFTIDGNEQLATAGDVVVAPAGVPHRAENAGEGPAHIRIEMRPALRWQELVIRLFAAARDGRTDEDGVPEPQLIAELLAEFPGELAPP